ncbi:MAG: hypothetical protein JNL60_11305 [Bacteroidia bacterium]|nr:hypothetical protein [Bacteroidia bacterium]
MDPIKLSTLPKVRKSAVDIISPAAVSFEAMTRMTSSALKAIEVQRELFTKIERSTSLNKVMLAATGETPASIAISNALKMRPLVIPTVELAWKAINDTSLAKAYLALSAPSISRGLALAEANAKIFNQINTPRITIERKEPDFSFYRGESVELPFDEKLREYKPKGPIGF